MANVRTIRRRIRSVTNTAKITKAMEMIAASKMRRAQQNVVAGRPYDQRIREVLSSLAYQIGTEGIGHPLMDRRQVQRVELIHISTDRGLCGGLNANVNRSALQHILDQNLPASIISVGRKGRDFMVRNRQDVRATFIDLGDRPNVATITPIAYMALEDYASHSVDQVHVVFSQFINTTLQRPMIQQLLPVQPTQIDEVPVGYIYEPNPVDLLDTLIPRYVEMQIYHALLESIASEQSARMVAMRSATDSANEMIQNLTLTMNKIRQEAITTELLDIVGGVSALKN